MRLLAMVWWRRFFLGLCGGIVPCVLQLASANGEDVPKTVKLESVPILVESSLTSAKGNIRQFAFDGRPATYFLSEENPKSSDHFTLRFDQAVSVESISVTTGKPNSKMDEFPLDQGLLEGSSDGKVFVELAQFEKGTADVKTQNKELIAVRIRPSADQDHPLAIQEVKIESKPPLAIFKYPVEFKIDASDAPELKEWAERSVKACERAYAMINEELASPGFRPVTSITFTLKNDYNGVAEAAGDRIKGSVKYYKSQPNDVGSLVHETVHVVQSYRGRGNPGWLVEGVADYIRFFKYEPGKIGRINAARARFDGSYRVTAAFLEFVTQKYDPQLVAKLNQAMREGQYKESLFQDYTKKSLAELDEEWRATLKK